MKKAFCALCLVLLLGRCARVEEQACIISGDIAGLEEPVYIWGTDRLYERIDTIEVENGHFEARIPIDTIAETVFMTPDGKQYPLFLEKGTKVSITGKLDSLIQVRGGAQNDSIYALLAQAADTTREEQVKMALEFIRRNPGSPATVFVLRHFFVEAEEPDREDIKEALGLLAPYMRDYLYVSELDNFASQTRIYNVGSTIPSFGLPNTKGENITRAKTFDGKLLLINFWASWDAASREENLAYRKLYKDQKKNKKFAMLGVSLDIDRASWLQGIEADTLEWEQVCNQKSWDMDLVKRLDIDRLPANVLVSATGTILGFNLSLEEINEEIKNNKK